MRKIRSRRCAGARRPNTHSTRRTTSACCSAGRRRSPRPSDGGSYRRADPVDPRRWAVTQSTHGDGRRHSALPRHQWRGHQLRSRLGAGMAMGTRRVGRTGRRPRGADGRRHAAPTTTHLRHTWGRAGDAGRRRAPAAADSSRGAGCVWRRVRTVKRREQRAERVQLRASSVSERGARQGPRAVRLAGLPRPGGARGGCRGAGGCRHAMPCAPGPTEPGRPPPSGPPLIRPTWHLQACTSAPR